MTGSGSSGESSTPTIGDDESGPGVAPAVLRRGDVVGRYVITGLLGHGGMGVVYAAHDPELDRQLAIKLLHPHVRGDLGGPLGQQRMLREARAMARLTHANVVTVHDVGPFERSVFVAMEFIDGQTLSKWTKAEPRSWRDTLAVFLAAGEGLAAAHKVGLVHRDFKPDNVMIATDRDKPGRAGRVVVMDFGLARTADEIEEHSTGVTSLAGDDVRLTQTGAVLGTPAYMSPEQHASAMPTARSDQFAFCVALHEALWRMRPFAADSHAALAAAVTTGDRREPPDLLGVPARIFRIIVRGLAVRPEDRWPSMRAMLDALGRDPARSRRRLAAYVGLPVLAVGGAVLGAAALDRAKPDADPDALVCAAGRARVEAIWNDDRRARIASAFAASGRGNADETRARVEAVLDRFVVEFDAEYTRACAATNLEHVQSAELLDRRMTCLARRIDEVSAVLTELERPAPTMVDRAVGGVSRAAQMRNCRDLEALSRAGDMPSDPDERAWVESLQPAVAMAKAQNLAGRPAEALRTIDGVLAQLDTHDVPRFGADVMFQRAQILDDAGDVVAGEAALVDAHWMARRSGNDDVAAMTAAELLVKVSRRDPAQAAMWEKQARAEVERQGDHGLLRARLLDDLAQVAMHNGDLDAALALHTESLPIWIDLAGAESLDVAVVEHGLGNVEFMRHDDAAARAHYAHALAIWREQLGDHHPRLATGAIMLGNLAHRAGDLDEAERQFDYSLEVGEAAYGPDHIELLGALNGLGMVFGSRGEHERALAIHERTLRIALAVLGPDHGDVATMQTNVGTELRKLGRYEEALVAEQAALVLRERTLGSDHAIVAESLAEIGDLLVSLGRDAEAEPIFARAVAIAKSVEDPPDSPEKLEAALAAVRARLRASARAP